MKKNLLAIWLLMFPAASFAQYEEEADSVAAEVYDITGICGVDFGTDFATAKTFLTNKFGIESDNTESHELMFKDKTYAGVFFNYLIGCKVWHYIFQPTFFSVLVLSTTQLVSRFSFFQSAVSLRWYSEKMRLKSIGSAVLIAVTPACAGINRTNEVTP